MKILLIHTYYTAKGGENVVFEQELSLLQQEHVVEALTFHNKSGLPGVTAFLLSMWNIRAARRLQRKINSFKPDLIHIHNLHFSAGPILIRTAKKMKVPLVLTLHNYRLLCPSATFLHHGQLFTDSLRERFPWTAIRYKVYRNSALLTFWLALVTWFHKKVKTWNQVDRFIALTEFARDLFLSSGLAIDAAHLVVKANSVKRLEGSLDLQATCFLFVGRLSVEKGIATLLEAFRHLEVTLNIVGEGPLAPMVKRASADRKNINYLGCLDAAAIRQVMTGSTALIVPSIWFEGMPMTILEAFSLGLPVIASKLGAMSTMVKDGYNGKHFVAGDASSLCHGVREWSQLPLPQKLDFSKNAYASYVDNYTPEENMSKLLNIYHSVLSG